MRGYSQDPKTVFIPSSAAQRHGGSQSPYPRYFYPGTEEAASAVPLRLGEHPDVREINLTLPPALHERVIEGTILWPDGRAAEGVMISLEDPRWSWQTNMVAATTDSSGYFKVKVWSGTRYLLHATSRARFTSEVFSIEPFLISGAKDELPQSPHLVLTHKGYTAGEAGRRQVEEMRKRAVVPSDLRRQSRRSGFFMGVCREKGLLDAVPTVSVIAFRELDVDLVRAFHQAGRNARLKHRRALIIHGGRDRQRAARQLVCCEYAATGRIKPENILTGGYRREDARGRRR